MNSFNLLLLTFTLTILLYTPGNCDEPDAESMAMPASTDFPVSIEETSSIDFETTDQSLDDDDITDSLDATNGPSDESIDDDDDISEGGDGNSIDNDNDNETDNDIESLETTESPSGEVDDDEDDISAGGDGNSMDNDNESLETTDSPSGEVDDDISGDSTDLEVTESASNETDSFETTSTDSAGVIVTDDNTSNDGARANEEKGHGVDSVAKKNDLAFTEITIISCIILACLFSLVCVTYGLRRNCGGKYHRDGHIAVRELNEDEIEDVIEDNETEMAVMVTED